MEFEKSGFTKEMSEIWRKMQVKFSQGVYFFRSTKHPNYMIIQYVFPWQFQKELVMVRMLNNLFLLHAIANFKFDCFRERAK